MIYTLDARGNVLLPVMVETFNLSDEQCSGVIQSEFAELQRKLSQKSIDYSKLKSALIPVHKNKREIAFVFDSSLITSAWYGNSVFQCILPVLNKESTYSILQGNIIADSLPNDIAKRAILGILLRWMAVRPFVLNSVTLLLYINIFIFAYNCIFIRFMV